MSTPSTDDVTRTTAVADPVQRNLRITQCYADLSQAMAAYLGREANWCTFATWASRQAGQTIRHEDLRGAVQDAVERAPEVRVLIDILREALRRRGEPRDLHALRETILDVVHPEVAIARAGDAVARGNLKVFAEIGYEFARYVEVLGGETAFDAAALDRFCDALRPGEPPEGQDLLRDAFTTYHRARFEADAGARSERLFYGNLLVGLHEQTRLQPEIAAALDASLGDPSDLKRRLIARLMPGSWVCVRVWAARLLGRRLPLDDLLDRLIDRLRHVVRRVISEHLMTLHLPRGVTLRLADDLTRGYPAALLHPRDEALLHLLKRLDPVPESQAGSGAADWADLDERMHFIAELFRCYHTWEPLFDPPFPPGRISAVRPASDAADA